jgi:hypothetical protein
VSGGCAGYRHLSPVRAGGVRASRQKRTRPRAGRTEAVLLCPRSDAPHDSPHTPSVIVDRQLTAVTHSWLFNTTAAAVAMPRSPPLPSLPSLPLLPLPLPPFHTFSHSLRRHPLIYPLLVYCATLCTTSHAIPHHAHIRYGAIAMPGTRKLKTRVVCTPFLPSSTRANRPSSSFHSLATFWTS